MIGSLIGDAAVSAVELEADPVLDAALAVFAELGLRRATVDDIAKRAGVGRVTIYRRIGGKPELIRAVMVREAGRLFTRVIEVADQASDLTERIALAFAEAITGVRENPIWQRLLSLEPETTIQQLTLGGVDVLTNAVAVATHIIAPEAAAEPSPELLARAELLVRVSHSVLLTPQVIVPLESYDDLAEFARRNLVPIAAAGGAGAKSGGGKR